jgi:hypothetical protein
MLLPGKHDFAASSHDSFDANSLVMVTLRQATSRLLYECFGTLIAPFSFHSRSCFTQLPNV